ncbi:hypothetical protein VTO73DRAFT_9192 [Trametes versicolor]
MIYVLYVRMQASRSAPFKLDQKQTTNECDNVHVKRQERDARRAASPCQNTQIRRRPRRSGEVDADGGRTAHVHLIKFGNVSCTSNAPRRTPGRVTKGMMGCVYGDGNGVANYSYHNNNGIYVSYRNNIVNGIDIRRRRQRAACPPPAPYSQPPPHIAGT